MSDELPYFPFYVDAFLGSGKVELMSTRGVGAYALLLCRAWREQPAGTLPDNDGVLTRWARVTPDEWMELKPSVLAPFTLGKDGRWHQKRMKDEYAIALKKFKDNQRRGLNGANARWSKQCLSIPQAMPINSQSKSKSTESRRDEELPAPLDTPQFRSVWEAWQKHRAEIGKKLKPTSISRQLKKFAEWGVEKSIEKLEHAMANGWQGFDFGDTQHGTNRPNFAAKPVVGYHSEHGAADLAAVRKRAVTFRPAPGADAAGGAAPTPSVPT